MHENLDVVSCGIYMFFYCWLVILVKRDSFTIYEPIIVTGFIGKGRYFIATLTYPFGRIWSSAGVCAISHETGDGHFRPLRA